MTTTATLITESFELLENKPLTVKDLVTSTSRSETAVRNALKAMLSDNEVEIGKLDGNVAFRLRLEPKATRKYRRHETPTTRKIRIQPVSKAKVQVILNGETDANGDEHEVGSKWVAVCLTHKTTEEHDLVLAAYHASAFPTFCPECVAAGVVAGPMPKKLQTLLLHGVPGAQEVPQDLRRPAATVRGGVPGAAGAARSGRDIRTGDG